VRIALERPDVVTASTPLHSRRAAILGYRLTSTAHARAPIGGPGGWPSDVPDSHAGAASTAPISTRPIALHLVHGGKQVRPADSQHRLHNPKGAKRRLNESLPNLAPEPFRIARQFPNMRLDELVKQINLPETAAEQEKQRVEGWLKPEQRNAWRSLPASRLLLHLPLVERAGSREARS
jgi:hypothetical protein